MIIIVIVTLTITCDMKCDCFNLNLFIIFLFHFYINIIQIFLLNNFKNIKCIFFKCVKINNFYINILVDIKITNL